MRHAVRATESWDGPPPTAGRCFAISCASLVEHERIITTTLSQGQGASPDRREDGDPAAKDGTLAIRAYGPRWLSVPNAIVQKVFDDIAPRFADRPGGYTRIVKLGPRKGDGGGDWR